MLVLSRGLASSRGAGVMLARSVQPSRISRIRTASPVFLTASSPAATHARQGAVFMASRSLWGFSWGSGNPKPTSPAPGSQSVPETLAPAPPPPTTPEEAAPVTPTSTTLDSQLDANVLSVADTSALTTPTPISSSDLAQEAMKLGDLKTMGLGGWSPSGLIQSFLELVHVSTGLPWWATIATVTLVVRCGLFPLYVKVQGNNARLANIQPQMQAAMARIKQAKDRGDTAGTQRNTLAVQQLFKDNNASPFKALLLPAVQMPLFISFFFALRGMATHPVPQMKDGGVAWFTDLTAMDPYYVLPIVSAGMTLLVLEVGAEMGTQVKTPQTAKIKNFARIASVAVIPFVLNFPAAVLVYWVTNNTFSLLQAVVASRPAVRAYFGIPKIKPRPQNPNAEPEPGFIESVKRSYEAFSEQRERTARATVRQNKVAAAARKRRDEAIGELMEGDAQADPEADNKKKRIEAARQRRQGRSRF